jgi:3-oxoacyl-[acyl-carrier protein] reductase
LVETEALQLHPLYREQKEDAIRRTPAGRIGTPEDIARIVLFLVSPQSDWIFGQTLVADGGLDLV